MRIFECPKTAASEVHNLLSSIISGLLLCTFLTGCEFHYSVDGQPGEPKETPSAAAGNGSSKPYVARVMTYNIQYLSPESARHGDRIKKLHKIIANIDPTIVAVQEVENREAMELVFPESEWLIVIDDDSDDRQDVAFAVKRPWKLKSIADDLDADNENFLAEESDQESFFPIRRDGLFVTVATPDGTSEITVVNIHAKARVGGRANTDHRRVGQSRVLVEKFRTDLKGRNIVLMGDFNDSPDDASLNILETGDAKSTAGKNSANGNFMVNLAEPLWDKNMVTQGANAKRLDRKSGLVNNIYPESRTRNLRGQRRNIGTGPILMDQILVSKNMADAVVSGSATIYRNPLALTGPGFSRPSDHLPMYADIKMQELK